MSHKIEIELQVKCQCLDVAELLVQALRLETEASLTDRSCTTITLNDSKTVVVRISSGDFTAARASANSFFLWLDTNATIAEDLLRVPKARDM